MNKFLYNGASLLIEDLNLELYWTPNRLYDPAIGRFQGIDKLADLFTSVSPMIYGFNNPIKFKDPTGLSGESSDCPEGQNCYIELPAFEVTDSRLPDYSTFLRQLRESNNPLSRALGIHGQSYGINSARDFLGRGKKLHYSEGEAIKYKDSEFMAGIRAMYKYGITGSMLVIAGSPFLIESLAQSGLSGSMVKNLVIGPKLTVGARWISGGLETASQLGTGTSFRDLDYFDIGAQSLFGFNTFGSILTGSFLDYRPFSQPNGNLGLNLNTGYRGLTNLGTGTVAGISTEFISNNVRSPGASFALFLGVDMIMKFNGNQLNKIKHD